MRIKSGVRFVGAVCCWLSFGAGCSDSVGDDGVNQNPIQPAAGVGGIGGAAAMGGAGGAAGMVMGGVGSAAGMVMGGVGGAAGMDMGGAGGAAGMVTGGAGGDAGGGAGGVGGDAGGGAGGMSGMGAEPVYEDPGAGPWQLVPEAMVAEECGMDPMLLAAANSVIGTDFAVVRYGKLCHQYGSDTSAEVWSASKTLGAVVTAMAAYETRDIPRTGPKTGPIMDSDLASYWLDSLGQINSQATLAHVLGMVGHTAGLETYAYDTVGSVQINRLSDVVNEAISQDSARLGANIEAFTQKFLFEPLGMEDSSWSGGAADKVYAYTWSATVHDMLKVGTLITHRGVYGGVRRISDAWIYKMTHPSFENANTAYGYLTWLNASEGGTGPGGDGAGNTGDPCAPFAVWPAGSFPHGESKATDCGYSSTCDQMHDIGVWSAQGLGGQFIVGHFGLDLVIAAKNFSGGGGPKGLWAAIRPALVAEDPMFMGDEDAFCAAYGPGNYAPDLQAPIVPPADMP
jgi:hypothetical protein